MSEEKEQIDVVEDNDTNTASVQEEVQTSPEVVKTPRKVKPAAKKVAKNRVVKIDKPDTPKPEEPKPAVEDLFSVVNKYARSQKEAQKTISAVLSGKSAAVNAQGRIVVDNHPFNKNGELFLRRNYGPIAVILNLLQTAKTDHIV